jgi:NTE family protein
MAVTIDGETKRVGLALSGGGFRAAAFHLGVFQKLESLGLLRKLDLLTCVSGGSIAGAFLAANFEEPDVLDRLESFLRTRSIAVSSVLGGVFDPFASRVDKLADSYDDHLFGNAKLEDLVDGPRLYVNATNLSTGNAFFFVTGGAGLTEMGEWELGMTTATGFRISRAVAASSAFPPVFPPLRIDANDFPSKDVDYVTLTDGGVYDNLGVNPLLRGRNRLDYAIVSDAGKPFAIDERPTESGAVVLKESISILMEQVRGLQFRRLQLAHASEEGPKPVWFSIDSTEGEQQEGDAMFSSLIRTNLKKLSDAEMTVLMRHGGALVEARVNRYAPELVSAD